VETKPNTKAGINAIDSMFLMALAGITFGTAVAVGRRFGLGWGLLAAPMTLAVVLALYFLFYWAVGFLPYPLGRPRRRDERAEQHESDSN
jgi:hypothetical protein